jgi:serine/threonine protein kinase
MNKQSRIFALRSLVVSLICFTAFSSAFAAADQKQIQSVVINNLQKKLKTDLANETVSVKLNTVEEYKISKNQIGLKGSGFCLITSENNRLPMTFDVKVNPNNLSVTEIRYDFAELTEASEYAPSSNEEFLMKELMGKISRDYKTDNIVISIDGMEDVSKVTNRKEFTGVGEVRIGTLVWNKIKFDVVFDGATNKAAKVVYKIEN